jgi:malonyl-CoA/methylmalonyl-CoA synthetase
MVERDAQDMAMICYTSGTTGRSKGAMLTHGNLVQNMEALHRAWRWRQDDVLLHGLPLFHIHGLIVALHGALNAGAAVRMFDRFDAARISRELAVGECTLFMGVPTMYRRLVDLWETEGRSPGLSGMRLFVCGSAPLPPLLFEQFRELTGYAILERYGMTETGIITSNPYDMNGRKPGSVGYPLEGVGLRIRGRGDREVPPGEVGEVQVKGPNVFTGYWKAPDKTASSFDGEWFRTGDLGRLDPADGHRLYLHGRSRELIITGGLNVYPREVEELLESRPDVQEAAVLGLEDPEWGERVIAVVVPQVDDPPKKEALTEFLRTRLAPYKCPKQILFIDSLPRNSMGKVMKSLIRI